MLSHLSIRNLALIDELTIEFEKGLNILTGETGAGKSIIIDAMSLILGVRADRELIQTGKEFAQVEGLFYLEKPEKMALLLEQFGIQPEEDGSLLLMRQLSLSDRNICRINGQTVTLSILREVSRQLVDVHGQHQHQSLLSSERHLEILDRLGGEPLIQYKRKVAQLYEQWRSIHRERDKLLKSERDSERMKDLLTYQINEISAANLRLDEEEEMEKERLLLQNAEKIIQGVHEAYEILYSGGPGCPAVFDQLSHVGDIFAQIAHLDDVFTKVSQNIEEFYYQLEEIIITIRNYKDSFVYQPHRLDEVESRLALIQSLKRKYGETIAEILSLKDELERELLAIENSKERLEHLKQQEEQVYKKLLDACYELSKKRHTLAEVFQQQLIEQLKELGMDKSRFKVAISTPEDHSELTQFKSSAITAQGFDQVEFMISPNIGEPLKPLAKIISGGEMSRVMLAFKTILAGIDEIPTLIFDEIDVGISGNIARVVAEKMNIVSCSHQIICVTHLPQIAVMADTHYKIEKNIYHGRTRTTVHRLDNSTRQKEITKLIGGSERSQISLKHAQELLDSAKQFKKNLN